MTGKSTDYGLRVLLSLAWPVIVARSSQAVIGFCDALMTAPLGEEELASVTTGSMNTFTLTIMPMGIVFIGQSFAAQLTGKGNVAAAVRYAWYGLMIALGAGAIAAAITPAIGPMLGLLDYGANVHRLMTSYIEIRLLAVGAVIATEALGNWYGGLGNTRLHMVAGLTAMVVNVFLNWVLITGNLGAPALGVEGAAIASVAATWIGFAVIAAAFAMGVAVPGRLIRPRGLNLGELVRMLRFGVPNGMSWFLEFAAFALFINVVVAGLGTTILAAMMVVIRLNSVSFMPAFGLTSAGAILTAQAIGRGKLDQVRHIVWRTAVVAMVWQGTVGLIYVVAPGPLMRWFASNGGGGNRFVEVGATLLVISAAWQIFDAISMTVGEALRSAGDTTWTLWARLLIAWFVFTPAGFLAVVHFDGGYVAAMLCVVGYLALLAGVLTWRFRSGAWRRIDLTGLDAEITQ